MGQMNKRKKHQDRDKYYRLAKEQGLRSRAAFKLVQINRQYHFLEKAKVVLDLCAAPGGWSQIASRTMSSSHASNQKRAGGSSGIVIAVDLHPIRRIHQNVITLIGDVTTDKCRAEIRRTLSSSPVDVVLSDGAPDIGASYDRDAYEQNEIALYSLKCATEHLRKHGTFVTKLYRSKDYTSFLWVARQLFEKVEAVKPASSRQASSEIFLVCLNYSAPEKVDPKLLDPKHVFAQLDEDEDEDGGGGGLKKQKKITALHKNFNKQKKNRQGYELKKLGLDATMRRLGSVQDFLGIAKPKNNTNNDDEDEEEVEVADPIQMLTDCTGLTFLCDLQHCSARKKKPKFKNNNNNNDEDDEEEQEACCKCAAYRDHPLTNTNIKACIADLKVLNRADFKTILSWRTALRQAFLLHEDADDDDDDDGDKKKKKSKSSNSHNDDDFKDDQDAEEDQSNNQQAEEEEDQINQEISQLYQTQAQRLRREKKKQRKLQAKQRRRTALGLDIGAIDDDFESAPKDERLFSLKTLRRKDDLERVVLGRVGGGAGGGEEVEDDDGEKKKKKNSDTADSVNEHSEEKDDNDDDEAEEEADKNDDDDDDDSVFSWSNQPIPPHLPAPNARRPLRPLTTDTIDETTGYNYSREADLDMAYEMYLLKKEKKAKQRSAAAEVETTKAGLELEATRRAKRRKKAGKKKAELEMWQDEAMTMENVDVDTVRYAKLLAGQGKEGKKKNRNPDASSDSDSSSDEDSDDGFHAKPLTPEEFQMVQAQKESLRKQSLRKEELKGKDVEHPLLYDLQDEDEDEDEEEEGVSKKAQRWFSNPVFESVGLTAAAAASKGRRNGNGEDEGGGALVSSSDEDDNHDDDDDEDVEMEDSAKDTTTINKEDSSLPLKKRRLIGLDADQVLASIPKTDKQKRHEKRVKAMERKQRRDKRRAKALGEDAPEFEVVPGTTLPEEEEDDDDDELMNMDEAERKKVLKTRALIKAGLGHTPNLEDDSKSGFQVVPNSPHPNVTLPVLDTRKYDSENEDYDSDDHARTLALGTMMLRQSKAKALVDASYNRYAWNDPVDLPDWFLDDEAANYRPQLPIPPALLEKMKARALILSNKPIKKVAQARARKKKRARDRLAAAKKKAESLANDPDMSEKEKLRAISKAMRGQDAKKPGKTYVVAKKGMNRGRKGVKLVDKRLKNDKRAMKHAEKRKKEGKKGGLTGSKRRRNHS